MTRATASGPGPAILPERPAALQPPRQQVPVDKAARIFIASCAAGFLAIAGIVVVVVVKFLL